MLDLFIYTSKMNFKVICLIEENFESFRLLDDRVVYCMLVWIMEGEGEVEYIYKQSV